ncbi:MAG TPA: ATP-binding cassette domain-containing protein, partial [Candidatus Polarisedimenticolia bacterium]|nr:ATP-binding cassette domain-containing protein [Candidatus Polarisedimenticolia bacterium]
SRSIRQNIALTPRQVTEAEIDDAVLASGLARDLPRFPEGLDTIVGERGFTVSGGQRQRVAIARALVARPSILIMDDALSSLDAQVERDVVEALRQEKGRATIVIVSHRVAALSWTDQILVMDSGAVVERGAHEELIRSGGLYALIARRQSLASTLEQL